MPQLRLALRTLLRTPIVTGVAILSLALGIGANAAIYSLFEQMLLRPLPVAQPEQLVNLAGPGPILGGHNTCNQAGGCDEVFSYPMFRDLAAAHTALAGIAAHTLFDVNVAFARQTPVHAEALLVSGSYFPVLGLRPALGRLLGPEDDQPAGAEPQAVLSYDYWSTTFGSNRSVVGQPLIVNGRSLTIVGVAPAGFSGTTLGARPLVFVPLSMAAAVGEADTSFVHDRQYYWLYLFGRVAPGASAAQADGSLNTVYHAIVNDVETPLATQLSTATLARFRAKRIEVSDGRRGQSQLSVDTRTPLVLLFGITGIVLLIACANIANLLLARAATRGLEMALRLSLGAKREQLIAQLLLESLLLAGLGGAASVLLAHWTLAGIGALLPPTALPGVSLGLSAPALVFTAGISIAAGLVFGLAPAFQSTRPDLVSTLRSSSGKLAGNRAAARFRSGLVTAQIALSMALLIAAGLFIKSLRNVSRVDLGIRIENVVKFSIAPALNGYDSTRARALYDRVAAGLATLPGVAAVTYGTVSLFNNWGARVSVQGFKKDPDTDASAKTNQVGPDYFGTLGAPLLAGRNFTAGDDRAAPRVAIVNEAFAEKFHLGRDAVGKRMSVDNDSLNITIVGLVKNSMYYSVKRPTPPVFVIPWHQSGWIDRRMTFYVRSAAPAERLLHAIPPLVGSLDPRLPIEGLESLPQAIGESVFLDRVISLLSAAFAALATLLAAVGLYGVLAYSVAQRTREIGVRMALGANAGSVRGLVLRQVGLMTAVGAALGVVAAVALGRVAQSQLFQMQSTDPVVFAVAAVTLSLVALGAGFLPALRASRVDPMAALRYE